MLKTGKLPHLVRPKSHVAHHCLGLHLELPQSWHVGGDPSHHEVMHKEAAHLPKVVEPGEGVRDVGGADHLVVVWDMDRTLLQHQVFQAWTVKQDGDERDGSSATSSN